LAGRMRPTGRQLDNAGLSHHRGAVCALNYR